MARIALFAHGGSGNHGCEAIVRGLVEKYGLTREDRLLSNHPEEDDFYGLNHLISVKSASSPVKDSFAYRLRAHLSGNPDWYYYKQRYRQLDKQVDGCDTAFSIGGDNYCYPGMSLEMTVMRQILSRRDIQTILMGCSVDISLLPRDILEDLNGYDRIICRETMTYHSLLALGINRLSVQPDPAFFMKPRYFSLPEGFMAENTIGINLSPLIINRNRDRSLIFRNYLFLVRYILDNTNMAVALIPHVIWSSNDDRRPLRNLMDSFSGNERVLLLEDNNADVIKGYIARCRFLVAARTHASIAGYGSGVPTLVLGYSIKSRGLAKDLFGTEKNYVLPAGEIKQEEDLTIAFRWLLNHEDAIRNHYTQVLPDYLAGGRF